MAYVIFITTSHSSQADLTLPVTNTHATALGSKATNTLISSLSRERLILYALPYVLVLKAVLNGRIFTLFPVRHKIALSEKPKTASDTDQKVKKQPKSLKNHITTGVRLFLSTGQTTHTISQFRNLNDASFS